VAEKRGLKKKHSDGDWLDILNEFILLLYENTGPRPGGELSSIKTNM
jgi:hypothetical protein